MEIRFMQSYALLSFHETSLGDFNLLIRIP